MPYESINDDAVAGTLIDLVCEVPFLFVPEMPLLLLFTL